MKKILCSISCLLFCILLNAQVKFEKGYFINNKNESKICLIKNIDWKNNPISFEYKLSETSASQFESIQNTTEFGVLGKFKFVRHFVKINTSSDDISLLDEGNNISFENKTLFLKELVEGDANLFYYENKDLRRFFFGLGTIDVEQLIYKRYSYSQEEIARKKLLYANKKISSSSIGINTTFKQQLWNNLKCDAISRQNLDKINYRQEELIKLFKKYNKCSDPNWKDSKSLNNKGDFNLTLRPGANLSNLNISSNRGITEFEPKTSLRFGIEIEFVLPFNKNKWSLVFEPTYRNYQSNATQTVSFLPDPQELDVDYKSIEFSAGFRYYSFLNDNSKLFLSAYMLNEIELNSSVSNPRFISSRLTIDPLTNFALGLGYKLKDKFSIEFRYDFDRGITRGALSNSEFKNVSLIFGYTIL
jgi:hypothetical protein